jgi:hypothetical protein
MSGMSRTFTRKGLIAMMDNSLGKPGGSRFRRDSKAALLFSGSPRKRSPSRRFARNS